MKILTVSCFSPYWQKYTPDVLDRTEGLTVGGGEEAFLRTAIGLRALGHEVTAFHYGSTGVWQGVMFNGPERPLYSELARDNWDAVVAWSGIRPLEYAPKTAKRILAQQLNDLWIVGDWTCVDCIVSPSQSHVEWLRSLKWLGPGAVVHNGVVPSVYETVMPWNERPNWVGYWSSPDRGLHHLLHAWPRIKLEVPDAKLHVFYEIKRFLDLAKVMGIGKYGERANLVGKAVAIALNDPSIVFHGATPRLKLAAIQKQCRVQCYPYDPFQYCEGFATAVCQGLAAGCKVLATPQDALPSLYGDGIDWFTTDPISANFTHEVVAKTVNALCSPDTITKRSRAIGLTYSWERAALEMEAACKGENWQVQRLQAVHG